MIIWNLQTRLHYLDLSHIKNLSQFVLNLVILLTIILHNLLA